ncbi:mucin-13-like isoform X2 [Acipenser ruthenus]|uniref:mucin-13-like isoform X2 n=1 Tax=Acipenser ruthenus TaxID=7906 RepID=UPI00274187B5|nr:mucin-13-like isoform X2 [Acipenser ruthenus]
MANILLLVGSICFLLAIQTATTSNTTTSSPDSSNSVTTDTTEATTSSTISSSPESSDSVITVTTEATTGSTISSSPDSSNSVTTDTTEATTGSTISSSPDSSNSVTTDTTEATTGSTISSSSDSSNSVTTDTTEATTGSTISSSPDSSNSVTTDTTEATTGSTISSSPDSSNSVTTDTTEAPHQCTTDSCKSHLAYCVQLNDNYTCQCVFGYYYDVDKCLQGKSFSGTIIHQFDISEDDISSTNSEGYTEIYRNVTSAISSGFGDEYGYKETIVLKIRVNEKIKMFSVRGGIDVSVDIVNIFSVESSINKSEVEKNVKQYLNTIGIPGYTPKKNCDYFNCNDTTSTCKEGDVTPTCECKDGYYKVDVLDKSCMPKDSTTTTTTTTTDFKMITIIVGCVSAVIILGLTGGLIAVAIRRKDIEDNEDDDNDRILVAKKQSGTFGLQNPAMTNSHVTSPFTFPKVQAGSDWNQNSQVKRNGLNPGPPSYPQRGNVYNDDDEENDDVHISNNKGRIGNRGQTNPYNNPYSPGPMKPTQLPRTNGMKYGSPYGDDDDDEDDGYHDIRGSSGVQMKPYNNSAPRATLDYSYPGSRKY